MYMYMRSMYLHYYFILVWCDNRTEELADELVKKTSTQDKNHFKVK